VNWGSFSIGIGIGALLGGVVGALVSAYLTRDTSFKLFLRQKRLETYLQIFEAVKELAALGRLGVWGGEETERKKLELEKWNVILQLVSSKDVVEKMNQYRDLEPNSDDRFEAQEKLITSIRKELKIND